MMTISDNATVYRMPLVQRAMITLETFCVHQSDIRIPTYITTEKKLDQNLLNQALNTEIARNDALRLFIHKKAGRLYDVFVPALPETIFPFVDFSDSNEKEMDSWLKEEASKPLNYLKNDSYRIYRFITPTGHSGIYFIVSHACMDLFGILAFYNDLMTVYDALDQGTELPRPLSSYEYLVQRQLEKEQHPEKPKKDLAFFEEKFRSMGPSFYAGIDCMKQLNETRKRKKNPTARYIDLSLSDPFHDASATLLCHVSPEQTAKMQAFCTEQQVSLQNLLYLGMRTYLSKVNELTDDVNVHFLSHRRATLSEKHCGGSCATVLPLRTVISKKESFLGALKIARNASYEILRHVDAPTFRLLFLPDKIEHRRKGATTASMMFTVCPPSALNAPPDWNPYFSGVGTGYFPFIAYAIVLPCPADGGLNCHYEYRTHRFTEKNLQDLHNSTIKVIEAGMANPNITIGELLTDIL